MKTKHSILSNLLPKIHAIQLPNWLRSALMTLTLCVAVLGVCSCNSDKDKVKEDHSQHQK